MHIKQVKVCDLFSHMNIVLFVTELAQWWGICSVICVAQHLLNDIKFVRSLQPGILLLCSERNMI